MGFGAPVLPGKANGLWGVLPGSAFCSAPFPDAHCTKLRHSQEPCPSKSSVFQPLSLGPLFAGFLTHVACGLLMNALNYPQSARTAAALRPSWTWPSQTRDPLCLPPRKSSQSFRPGSPAHPNSAPPAPLSKVNSHPLRFCPLLFHAPRNTHHAPIPCPDPGHSPARFGS